MNESAAVCESATVELTAPELELYKVFVDCTPLNDFLKAEMKDLRDPKLEVVQEACRKGVPGETLLKSSTQEPEMQMVPWIEPAVPIEAVPLRALAPRRQRVRRAREEFRLPPGWTVKVNVRTAGKFKGKVDKTYLPPHGNQLRSLRSVKIALGII